MTKGKAPISSHRAFPAIVALWFAALLGLGSLALPVALIERLVALTGLGSAWPAAQPPLGVTARLAIALVCAALGAFVGVYLARKVAASQTVESPRRRKAAPIEAAEWDLEAKRPLSPREDLGFDSIDAADEADRPLGLGRRRALAVTEESGRSDFLEAAPLPGQQAHVAEALDLGVFEDEAPEPQAEPVEERRGRRPAEVIEPEDQVEPEPADFAPQWQRAERVDEPVEAFDLALDPDNLADEEPVEAAPAHASTAERPLSELGIVELVDRFARSLQRRSEAAAAPVTLPQLKASRAPLSAAPEVAPAPQPAEESFAADELPTSEMAGDQDAAPTIPPLPAALRPIDFDELDSDEAFAPPAAFTLKLDAAERPFDRFDASETAESAEPESDDAEDSASDDGGYGSLLAMRSPLGQSREFVRVDDEDADADSPEPVVVFPGQLGRRATPAADGPSRAPIEPAGFRPFDGPVAGQGATQADFANPAASVRPAAQRPDPRETERSLREALEKLQRMSGAA